MVALAIILGSHSGYGSHKGRCRKPSRYSKQ
jgi:hypothetical protein